MRTSRSIADIREAFTAEYGQIPLEGLMQYFGVFEKAGLMTIRDK